MFAIQYETVSGAHAFEKFESESWQLLIHHLAEFKHPIMAVYERDVPITKAVRTSLAQHRHPVSRRAREFIECVNCPA